MYGINFANDAMTEAAGFPVQDVLAGASVTVNGSKVPILSVSPWQINALLPQETPAQSGDFQVSFLDGAKTPAQTANIVTSAPTCSCAGFSPIRPVLIKPLRSTPELGFRWTTSTRRTLEICSKCMELD